MKITSKCDTACISHFDVTNDAHVTDLIERVRKLVTEGGMSRAGLARAAGLHANTLRDCTSPGWNPTADTLAKLNAR
jgi:DNA-binding phage protein